MEIIFFRVLLLKCLLVSPSHQHCFCSQWNLRKTAFSVLWMSYIDLLSADTNSISLHLFLCIAHHCQLPFWLLIAGAVFVEIFCNLLPRSAESFMVFLGKLLLGLYEKMLSGLPSYYVVHGIIFMIICILITHVSCFNWFKSGHVVKRVILLTRSLVELFQESEVFHLQETQHTAACECKLPLHVLKIT
jgi:hypothetical protein